MLIGEVAQLSGLSTRMLRHYDRMGVVSPSGRTPGGYRHYTDDDLRRLFHAEALRSLGLSLARTAAILDQPDFVPSAVVDTLVAQTRARVAQQQELLATLERVRRSEPDDWTDVLRTLALLRGLDSDGPSTRQRVALSMSDPAGRDGPLLVEAALAETDPGVAGALVWALARAGDTTVPVLVDALGSDDAGRRRRAVEALEKIGTERATAALADALGHPDPWVDRRAALAAAAHGRPEAVPVLVALIVAGEDDSDAARVLGLLVRQRGLEASVDGALARAIHAGDADQRVRLASALAEIPGEAAAERLRAVAHDDDRRVALAARFALTTHDGSPTSQPATTG